MIYHKLVDAALHRDTSDLVVTCSGADRRFSDGDIIGEIHDFGKRLEEARVFVFENLPLTDDGNGALDLPGIDDGEREMFFAGLIPLPFERCWFEAQTQLVAHGIHETFGFLVEAKPDRFVVEPVRITDASRLGSLRERTNARRVCFYTGERWEIPLRDAPDTGKVMPFDPLGAVAYMNTLEHPVDNGARILGEVGLLGYLMLMLCSRSTEVENVPAPAKLNKARLKKGRTPLPDHAVVSIVPKAIARAMRAEGGEADGPLRNSPRLHWRRSHRRTYKSGRVVVIARLLIGFKSLDGQQVVPTTYRVIAGQEEE